MTPLDRAWVGGEARELRRLPAAAAAAAGTREVVGTGSLRDAKRRGVDLKSGTADNGIDRLFQC